MAFPISLTNAIDGDTEIIASHLNNLEAKVGIDGSLDTSSLDYILTNTSSLDPGHKHKTEDGASDLTITQGTYGNLGLNSSIWGASAEKVIAVGQGVPPVSSPPNIFQMYGAEISADKTCPHFLCEDGTTIILSQGAAITAPLTSITASSPGTPDYAIANGVQNTGYGFSTADEFLTVMSVIANLQERVNALEAQLQDNGLLQEPPS
jgi:hypothetical protein